MTPETHRPDSAAAAPAGSRLARLQCGHNADVVLAQPERASAAALGRAHAVLDDAERARAAAFARQRDRDLYAFSHGFLRLTLARYLGADARALRFRCGAAGRPELMSAGRAPIRFNLSHTEGLVACIVTGSAPCGVDVESFARIDHRKLPARLLAAPEADALMALSEALRRDRLLEIWTLKEAYLKARGLGLSKPLRDIAFSDFGAAPRCAVGPGLDDRGSAWRFWSGAPTPHHRAAAAIRTGGEAASFSILDAEI